MPGPAVQNLEILRWVHGGDGLGVVKDGPLKGLVVFVAGAVPGDRVDVRLNVKKKRWARGTITRLRQSSPDRVQPPCNVQRECGGCPWMIGTPALQRRELHRILSDEVEKRFGDLESVGLSEISEVVAGASLGYRNRLRLGYRVGSDGYALLGFRAARSDKLVPITSCAVALPEINEALARLRDDLASHPGEEGEVRMLAFDGEVTARIEPVTGPPRTWGAPVVTVRIADASLTVSAADFVQGNADIAGRMADHVERWARSSEGDVAVELFCGSGTFTVPLLKAGFRVTGYEISSDCEKAFRHATEPYGLATFVQQDLLGLRPYPDNPPGRVDAVLLDPPRSGAGEVMEWIVTAAVPRVLMVSCDLATALRDLKPLMASGYRCKRIQSFDLFPHTGHQELIIEVER